MCEVFLLWDFVLQITFVLLLLKSLYSVVFFTLTSQFFLQILILKQLKIFLVVLSIYSLQILILFLSLFGRTWLFILFVRYCVHLLFLVGFFHILLLNKTTFPIFFRLHDSLLDLILLWRISRTPKSCWTPKILRAFNLGLRIHVDPFVFQILIYPIILLLYVLLNIFIAIIVFFHFYIIIYQELICNCFIW